MVGAYFVLAVAVWPVAGTLVHNRQIEQYGAGTRIRLDQVRRGPLPESAMAAAARCPEWAAMWNPIVNGTSLLGLFTGNATDHWRGPEAPCPGDDGTGTGAHHRPPCRMTQLPLVQVWWRAWDAADPYSTDGRWSCPMARSAL